MKCIVGLGNPGKEYEKTRHNSGFMVMDCLLEKLKISKLSRKFDALITIVTVGEEKVLLMKPQTYMNASGSAVSKAMQYYHLEPDNLLVVHDDMDLPVGSLRIRKKGSSGGQKGMEDIMQALKTQEIARIRIGVGHSMPKEHDLVPDWVLSSVSKAEEGDFYRIIQKASEACYAWINEPLEKVMATYNTKEKKKEETA